LPLILCSNTFSSYFIHSELSDSKCKMVKSKWRPTQLENPCRNDITGTSTFYIMLNISRLRFWMVLHVIMTTVVPVLFGATKVGRSAALMLLTFLSSYIYTTTNTATTDPRIWNLCTVELLNPKDFQNCKSSYHASQYGRDNSWPMDWRFTECSKCRVAEGAGNLQHIVGHAR